MPAGTISRRLRHLSKKAILTVRSAEEGGSYSGTEEDRLDLIAKLAATMRPAFLDVELKTAKENEAWFEGVLVGPGRAIVSWHDFKGTPDIRTLRSVREEGKRYGDIVKIVTMAQSPEDSIRLLKLYAEDADDLIAFCMGASGIASRVLSFQLGSPIIYVALPGEPAVAPGQLSLTTVKTLKRIMTARTGD